MTYFLSNANNFIHMTYELRYMPIMYLSWLIKSSSKIILFVFLINKYLTVFKIQMHMFLKIKINTLIVFNWEENSISRKFFKLLCHILTTA